MCRRWSDPPAIARHDEHDEDRDERRGGKRHEYGVGDTELVEEHTATW